MPQFGTDGVRGVANVELTPELRARARAGRGAGARRRRGSSIGRDTRRLGSAARGRARRRPRRRGRRRRSTSACCRRRAWPSWPRPTASPAAMISASHNPFADNGIKLFAPGGRKLPDEVEAALEAELARVCWPTAPGVGPPGERRRARSRERPGAARAATRDHLVGASLDGRRLDGLRGRARLRQRRGRRRSRPRCSQRARRRRRSSSTTEPDGTNINDGCGSTHPERPAAPRSSAQGADVGLAFDGDADRVLAVDDTGAVVDGDQHHRHLRRRPARSAALLRDDTVVVTVMTNLGFRLGMAEAGHHGRRDRRRRPLRARGARRPAAASLGGEQSRPRHLPRPGHHRRRPADRAAAARRRGPPPGRPLADLAAGAMTRLPQVLVNVRVAADGARPWPSASPPTSPPPRPSWATHGRVLVRPSGTEPLVRVMVEAPSHDEAEPWPTRLVDAVERAGRGGAAARRLTAASRAGAVAGRPVASDPAMCGIIAECSIAVPDAERPAARRPASTLLAAPRRARSARCRARVGTAAGRPSVGAVAAPRRARSTGCCGASPACAALLADPRRVCGPRDRAASTSLDARRRRRRAPTCEAIDVGRRRRGASTPRSSALKDALWAVARDRLRTARGRGRPGRAPTPAGARSAASPSVQVALSALDRLEVRGRDSAGAAPARARPRPRPRRAADRGARWPRAPATRCSRRARCGSRPRAHCRFVYKAAAEIGELGDNTARPARRDPRRRPAAPGPGGADGASRRCSATPAGRASASSPSPTPIRSTTRRRAADGRPVRRRRAQRRRRQLRRPEGRRRSAHPAADHHRRQGDPDAGVAPARRRRRRRPRRSGARSPRFEGSVAIAAGVARPARPRCCSRCGAAVRRSTSASPTTPTSWPASRTALVEETQPLPAHGRRDAGRPGDRTPAAARSSCSTAPAPARSRASAGSPTTAPSCPVDRRRAGHGRDHDARHRPWRRPRTSC